jgi:N-methylhydantoinase A
MVECIRKSGLNTADIDELIHGSTIAINTLIERKGAKTGLVVTRGTRDVYIIGRGNRPEAYNLFFHRHKPLVSRRHTYEIAERMLAGGEVDTPLKKATVAAACKALKAEGIEAVAVCFLHAYANPEHERTAGEMIRKALPGVYLSLSHDILREYREFERMSTTVVNAYIGPKVGGYVKDLRSGLGKIGFKSLRRRPSSISRSTRCRWRCARCRWRRATTRATSRWWRRAAQARSMSARLRASSTSRR